MTRNPTRQKVLIGFAIAAAVLVCASTAYACTIFKGHMTVTVHNRGGDVSQTVTGDASQVAPQMFWCTDPNNPAGPPPDPDPTWSMTIPKVGGSISFSTSDATSFAQGQDCLAPANTNLGDPGLNRIRDNPAGTKYQFAWKKGLMPGGGGNQSVHNCHSANGVNVLANNIDVVNGVSSGGPYAIGTINGNPSHISVCLWSEVFRPDANALNIIVL